MGGVLVLTAIATDDVEEGSSSPGRPRLCPVRVVVGATKNADEMDAKKVHAKKTILYILIVANSMVLILLQLKCSVLFVHSMVKYKKK